MAVNIVALAIVAGGILYLNDYEKGLIQERLKALTTQGEVIAAALGESVVPPDPAMPQAMEPVLASILLKRLAAPINARARLFDNYGRLMVDTRLLAAGGAEVLLRELPPPSAGPVSAAFEFVYRRITRLFRYDLPLYVETSRQEADDYGEVLRALAGERATAHRVTPEGESVLSVAVPVQRFKRIVGGLMLASGTQDIVASVRNAQAAILQLSLVAFGVTFLLSIYLAGTIARPIRQLATAAEAVTRGTRHDGEIPDLSRRHDEIGELSVALRRMTTALQERLGAIEGFAADVAHELKNPLSSLRSAVETINRIDDAETQNRLMAILAQDVQRMDRLITDIAAASRVDAELARAETGPVNLTEMLTALVDMHESTRNLDDPHITLVTDRDDHVVVPGVEPRLVQVFRNLIENAVSFSPPGEVITVNLRRDGAMAEVLVEDRGPGLPVEKTEAIFDRFYTHRPASEAFGTHSGLGLSISRQIVVAHGGTIEAKNIPGAGPQEPTQGACFAVRLPA